MSTLINPFDGAIETYGDFDNFSIKGRDITGKPFMKYNQDMLKYRYSLTEASKVLKKHYTTLAYHRDNGKIKFNEKGKTSLYHIEKLLLNNRNGKSSYKRWTPEEDELVLQYMIPNNRTEKACRVRRCRLKKAIK